MSIWVSEAVNAFGNTDAHGGGEPLIIDVATSGASDMVRVAAFRTAPASWREVLFAEFYLPRADAAHLAATLSTVREWE